MKIKNSLRHALSIFTTTRETIPYKNEILKFTLIKLWIIVFAIQCITVLSSLANAASPTQQPLLHSTDITYVGSFQVPNTADAFSYGGMGLAVSEDGKSLYVGGHVYNSSLGQISIPDPIGGTATLLKAPVTIPGAIGGICGTDIELSGALVHNGRIIVQKRCYYDNEGETGNTHAAGSLNISEFSSFSRLANITYKQFASGYMGRIPTEWQSLLGGPAFTGNGVMSINSQCSNGPSFYVFNPDDVGLKAPIPSIPLMYFPLSNPLSNPDVANDIFSRADQYNAGIVFPSGTRSVLYFHRHGYGNPTYKVEDGCGGISGEGAAPYRRQITAFDANDLLAVKNGTKQPYSLRPYEWWVVPGPSDSCGLFSYSGLAYDHVSRRIFAALRYEESPQIHVWQISGTGAFVKFPPKTITTNTYSSCAIYKINGQLVSSFKVRYFSHEGELLDFTSIKQALPVGIYLYQFKGNLMPSAMKQIVISY